MLQKTPVPNVVDNNHNAAASRPVGPLYSVIAAVITLIVAIVVLHMVVITNTIVIQDQSLDGGIYIQEVSLTRGGFLLIRDLYANNMYAYTSYLPPGRYKDLYLPRLAMNTHPLKAGDYLIAELWENKSGEVGFDGTPIFHPKKSAQLHYFLGGVATKTVHVQ